MAPDQASHVFAVALDQAFEAAAVAALPAVPAIEQLVAFMKAAADDPAVPAECQALVRENLEPFEFLLRGIESLRRIARIEVVNQANVLEALDADTLTRH